MPESVLLKPNNVVLLSLLHSTKILCLEYYEKMISYNKTIRLEANYCYQVIIQV